VSFTWSLGLNVQILLGGCLIESRFWELSSDVHLAHVDLLS
jgi:hypothetical protein